MPLALPRRRALPDATLKSNKAGARSRFVKGEGEDVEAEDEGEERAAGASKFFREAWNKGKRKKGRREGREGREEDEDQEEKDREKIGEEGGRGDGRGE